MKLHYFLIPLSGAVDDSTTTPSSGKCTISERNTFALLGAFQLMVSNCLTVGGQTDNEPDVLACMADVIAKKMGVAQMNYDCYTCLIDGVQVINQLPTKTLRDACITDITSDARGVVSGSVDLSSLIDCTGGYDPTQALIEAYCSEENAIEFIKTSMYRSITADCLSPSNFAASNSTSLLDCMTTTMINSGGNFTD